MQTTVFDTIEGFYTAHILMFLRERRLFDRFRDFTDASAVGKEQGLDPDVFRALFEFLHLQTDFVLRNDHGHYRFTEAVRPFYCMEFQIDKFLRAYGPAIADLGRTLTGPALGRYLVDRKVEADAYGEIASPPNPLVLQEVKQRGLRSLLDFGCGPGTLLARLASEDTEFVGWGLDIDGEMLRVARTLAEEAGFGERLGFVKADAAGFAEALPEEAIARAQAIHCKGLFDEFFRHGDDQAIGFLQKLRSVFPGRVLFIVDYYGSLMREHDRSAAQQHTILHDLLQFVTAQGAPPADLGHWVEIYAAAGCEVLHAYEGNSSGIKWFVHVVQL